MVQKKKSCLINVNTRCPDSKSKYFFFLSEDVLILDLALQQSTYRCDAAFLGRHLRSADAALAAFLEAWIPAWIPTLAKNIYETG